MANRHQMLGFAGVAIVAEMCYGQAINLDFGLEGRPNSAYGAASGQVGWWSLQGDDAILDIHQNPTGISFGNNEMGFGSGSLANASADDIALMSDYLVGQDNSYLIISGIKPGAYHFYLYAWNFQPGTQTLGVLGAGTVQTTSTGIWPGGQVKGETYNTIDVNVNGPVQVVVQSDHAYWQGLQIVPIPAPASVVTFVPVAGFFARQRRRVAM